MEKPFYLMYIDTFFFFFWRYHKCHSMFMLLTQLLDNLSIIYGGIIPAAWNTGGLIICPYLYHHVVRYNGRWVAGIWRIGLDRLDICDGNWDCRIAHALQWKGKKPEQISVQDGKVCRLDIYSFFSNTIKYLVPNLMIRGGIGPAGNRSQAEGLTVGVSPLEKKVAPLYGVKALTYILCLYMH